MSDFAKELAAMAQSHVELPQVRAELAEARQQITKDGNTVARLELKLHDRAAEIEMLNARIRELEAARDDAELRFLEADDRISAFKRLVGAFSTDATTLVKAMEPPAPPVIPEAPKAEEVASLPNSETGANPAPESTSVSPPPHAPQLTGSNDSSEVSGEPSTSVSGDPGQRASGESVASMDGASTTAHSTTTVQETGSASNAGGANPGPYSGKRYYDHPAYVTLTAWLAGGGTEADYNWRPGQQDMARS